MANNEEKKYNGWTNYETWNIALWLGNDEGSSNYWMDVAKETLNNAIADKTFSKIENAKLTLMQMLKDEIGDNNPLIDSANMYSDLLNAAISEVNFYEIASHYIDDIST